jgi:hypothetical protein
MKKSALAIAVASVGVLGASGVGLASGGSFIARPMTGANEVPANSSTAEARAWFTYDGHVVHYRIKMLSPITGAFMGHIHLGAAGSNGGIVVWLFGDASLGTGNPTVDFDGNDWVAMGEITDGDLVNALAGHPLSDLVDHLADGSAYVNLHTRAKPGGEIRAQVEVNGDG